MTSTRPLVRIGELVKVHHGWPFKSSECRPYDTQDIEDGPLVTSIGHFDYSGGFRGNKTALRRYLGLYPAEYELNPGDILLVMTCQTEGGEILGVPAVVPDDGHVYLHNQRIGRVDLLDPDRLHPDYFYHFARSEFFNRQLFVTASGSKILHTSPGRIEDTTIELPPLVEQEAIAEVLGALDDKIATNDRLARTSLELADALYARAARGVSLSERTFADVGSIHGGGTPRTKIDEYWNGDINWATPTDVTGLASPYLEATTRRITDAGFAACSSNLHPAGSILMTSRATVGAFAIAQQPTAVNQGFIVMNATDPEAQWWLFHEMRSQVPEFLNHANGATFPELSRGKFKKLPLRYPDSQVFVKFSRMVGPIHERAAESARETARLANLRDTLLPALMSGRLSVKDAENKVAEVV